MNDPLLPGLVAVDQLDGGRNMRRLVEGWGDRESRVARWLRASLAALRPRRAGEPTPVQNPPVAAPDLAEPERGTA